MCGIAGIFSLDATDPATIERMTNALGHRGPDAQGTYLNENATMALGHTRLSIIDLSAAANQPFHSRSGRYVVVYNGEIYNFKTIRKELESVGRNFETHSDTEVIVEAFETWGTAMVTKLEGMFAVAIADKLESKLFLFRDRLGKKPVFYFQSDRLFAFASEIKSLLQHPWIARKKRVDRNIVSTFLHLGYIPGPDTIYSNIHKFPQGHLGVVDQHLTLDVKPYWNVTENLSDTPTTSDPSARLDRLMDDAVQKRLVGDVPIGAFLSGGTDSSLVTAYATRHAAKPIKTFSIGFEEDKFDERSYARQVAGVLKTDHHEYILREHDAMNMVETYLRHFDEPFADTSAIPTMLVSKLAREEVKVVLTGDGGDELFQGYGAYHWADRLGTPAWKLASKPLSLLLRHSGQTRYQRVAELLSYPGHGSLRSHIFSQEQYFFSQDEIRTKLLKEDASFRSFEYDESFLPDGRFTDREKQALFDLRFYLPDDLLVKVDRASMYYALECRCPLLDHHLVEFAVSVELSQKKQKGTSKWLLKQLLRRHLPDTLVDRPKWGFSVPLLHWLKGDLHYLVEDFLSDQCLEEVGMFNAGYIHWLKKEFYAGKDYLFNRLWVLIVWQKWYKENVL